MSIRRALFAGLVPVVVLAQGPQTRGPAARAALAASLDSAARTHVAAGSLVGMSVAVVHRGDTLLNRSYGFADLEHEIPGSDRAVYALGSMTKQFTGVAIHHLADRGLLDLDADVRTYLPELNTHGRVIPVWRLLDHTSGLAEYTGLAGFGALSVQTPPRDTIVRLINREPPVFEPGSQMIYNNTGFFLGAMIVARVSGQSFESYLTDHLLKPLGMEDSRYCDERAVMKGRARGYQRNRAGAVVNASVINHQWPYGAGSMCGSARDLIRWNQALHHGGVLKPATYSKLVSPRALVDGSPIRYSGGLSIHRAFGYRTIEHGGAIDGFLSNAGFYPDDDLLVVVLQNDQARAPALLTDALAAIVLGPAAVGPSGRPPDMTGFAGVYRGLRRGGILAVTVDTAAGLRLTVEGSEPVVPVYQSASTWVAGATQYTFVRRAGGAVELRVELLWRPGGIYSHYVLRK